MNRRAAALIGLLALAITAALLGTTGTLATWTDTATVRTTNDAFSSAGLAAPRITGSTQVVGGHQVRLAWDPVAVGAHGARATGYEVLRTGGGPDKAQVQVCATTETTCLDPGPVTSPVTYILRARFATEWTKDSSAVRYEPDVVGPASVDIRGPRDGFTAFPVLMSVHLGARCRDEQDDVFACGSVSREDGVRVEYRLKRWRTRAFGSDYDHACWVGGSDPWKPVSATASCDWAPASVGGAYGWFLPGPSQGVYPPLEFLREHRLEVRAIDRYGNVGATATSSFAG